MGKTAPTLQVTPLTLGMMSRIFLVQGDAGVIVVDAGMRGQTNRIIGALAQREIAPQDVRLLLITHGHLDHFGGAKALQARTGAPVAVHAQDADALRAGRNLPTFTPTSWPSALLMRVGASLMQGHADSALEPDIVFTTPWRLDDYGIAGEVIHTPGHTPGSVTLLLDNGVAIVGDLAMGNMLFPKRATAPLIAWNPERNWESLRLLLEHHPTLIYVTHGQPLTPAALHALLKQHT